MQHGSEMNSQVSYLFPFMLMNFSFASFFRCCFLDMVGGRPYGFSCWSVLGRFHVYRVSRISRDGFDYCFHSLTFMDVSPLAHYAGIICLGLSGLAGLSVAAS